MLSAVVYVLAGMMLLPVQYQTVLKQLKDAQAVLQIFGTYDESLSLVSLVVSIVTVTGFVTSLGMMSVRNSPKTETVQKQAKTGNHKFFSQPIVNFFCLQLSSFLLCLHLCSRLQEQSQKQVIHLKKPRNFSKKPRKISYIQQSPIMRISYRPLHRLKPIPDLQYLEFSPLILVILTYSILRTKKDFLILLINAVYNWFHHQIIYVQFVT